MIPMLWQEEQGEYSADTGKWSNVIYMPCTKENNFAPELPTETPDIIYLCFPNNPTGSTITKSELQKWVDYANKVGAVIIMMQHMKHTFLRIMFLIQSMSAKEQRPVRLRSEASPKMLDLPVQDLVIPWFRSN